MSAPRIHKEIGVAAEVLEMNKEEINKMQDAVKTATGREEAIAERVVEYIFEYLSNLHESQLDELNDLYVREDWRDE